MMKKNSKSAAATPVEDYEQHEYTRPTLPTGEYSGIASEYLMGVKTPTVRYSLGGIMWGTGPVLDLIK